MKYLLLTTTICIGLMGCKRMKPKNDLAMNRTTVVHEYSCDGAYGIDIYDRDTILSWKELAASGISFVYMKATDGISYPMEIFSRQWDSARSQNIVRGAYHFYEYTDQQPEKQAEFFIDTVLKDTLSTDLPPALDLEFSYNSKGDQNPIPNKGTFQENVIAWLKTVEKAFGKKPVIYVDPSFANTYLNDTVFGNYPLWIADYRERDEPEIPSAWNGKKWFIWQQGSKYQVDGIKNHVDYDCMNGKLND